MSGLWRPTCGKRGLSGASTTWTLRLPPSSPKKGTSEVSRSPTSISLGKSGGELALDDADEIRLLTRELGSWMPLVGSLEEGKVVVAVGMALLAASFSSRSSMMVIVGMGLDLGLDLPALGLEEVTVAILWRSPGVMVDIEFWVGPWTCI